MKSHRFIDVQWIKALIHCVHLALFSFLLSLEQAQSRLETKKAPSIGQCFYQSDSAGIRTQDPYIKSVLLYQLSYGIVWEG